MIKRIGSTIFLWGLAGVFFFYFGGDASVWLLAFLSFGTQWEFYGLLEKMGRKPFKNSGTALGTIMIVGPYYASKSDHVHIEGIQSGIIAIAIVACCLRILNERDSSDRIETLGSTLLGLIYIPFMLAFLVRILELPGDELHGLMLIAWTVGVAKFCDIGALLFGKAFGKHQMSPKMSPKKTWEGAVGGCLVSIGVGFAISHFGAPYLPPFFNSFWGTLFALPIAIVSIISDLVESVIKRRADQKDSGKFIPGIGGAFDLTDSLILSAPVAFLLLGLIS